MSQNLSNGMITNILTFLICLITGMLFLLSNPRDYPVDDMVSEEDVVIVTLSYRVNAFGFFCYEDPLMPGL